LVAVDYEPLPVVVDVVAAGEPGAHVLHGAWGDNVGVHFRTGFGDVDGAFRAADVRVKERFEIQRYVGMPIETRGRPAQWDARDGTMLAVRDRIWVDLGAYNVWGIVLPYNTVAHLLGPHRVANLAIECRGVVTNKAPNAPYRGAGRPETVFAMDRIVDRLARD